MSAYLVIISLCSYIRVCDLNLLRSKCNIIGDPKVLPYNKTPLMEESVTPILDQDRADPDLKVDDDSHRRKEPPALKQNPSDSTQKCSSHSPTHNKKRKLQSSDDGVGACYKKLGTLEEGVSKLTTEKNKVDVNLTSGAILKIVTDKCTSHDLKPVLQLMYICSGPVLKDDEQLYAVMLSDGSFWQFGSIVQLTQFCTAEGETITERGILVFDLNVIRSEFGLIGDPKLLPCNETPLVERYTATIPDEDHVNSHLNEDIDDSHHVEERPTSKQKPSASTKKCCSHGSTQNKKRKRQLSNDNISVVAKDISKIARIMVEKEDKMMAVAKDVSRMMIEKNKEDDMGACFKKLENIGWGTEDPLYDTALLLFGESADYRKLWLHLKPESCGKWVKNAGSKFGLLD